MQGRNSSWLGGCKFLAAGICTNDLHQLYFRCATSCSSRFLACLLALAVSPPTAADAMVSWNDISSGSSDDDSVNSQLPRTITCKEWSGVAEDLPARCQHRSPCVKLVTFESVDSGRKFLACAEKDERKCSYLEWVDPEWPGYLKMCLAKLWSMYEEENRDRLTENGVNAEENFKILEEKRKMENELRFFKLDFAKMVCEKEEAVSQLGNAQLALTELKAELEKKNLADHASTDIHQLLREKNILL